MFVYCMTNHDSAAAAAAMFGLDRNKVLGWYWL